MRAPLRPNSAGEQRDIPGFPKKEMLKVGKGV